MIIIKPSDIFISIITVVEGFLCVDLHLFRLLLIMLCILLLKNRFEMSPILVEDGKLKKFTFEWHEK